MSLGFLTESALVPSKGKNVKVGGKSLVGLSAAVFSRQEKLREEGTLEDDFASSKPTSGRRGKYAKKVARKRKAKDPIDGGKRTKRNKNVEKRMHKDEAARAEQPTTDADWHRKSKEALERKSRLYDRMMQGSASANSNYLVDFARKRDTNLVDTVDIIDEFGRTRTVQVDSDEHRASLEANPPAETPSSSDKPVPSVSDSHEDDSKQESETADRATAFLNDLASTL